ncbi:uncharacterized protein LOC106167013 [Lingula anatina]|uniref:Uncharacterized protein LOC106167013 n=1 Tax=Lingula anatina TaxID=7574 RepID=A0A1S3IUD1_LINAN|nr:uncharacterized protein LOC106167013 [Lingula anatina]|eukprot:XP_013401139.1 uncharacterized protein LOC106167013 [Lingula anatina]
MHLFLAIVLFASLAVTEGAYISPPFLLRHRSSGQCYAYAESWFFGMHYETFRADDCSKSTLLRWYQKEGQLGYLKVEGSDGHCLTPLGSSAEPADNTAIFPHPKCDNAALFTIEEGEGRIKHSGGKYVHTSPYNQEKPGVNSDLIIRGGTSQYNQFDFVDKQLNKVQVIPNDLV